MKSKIFTNRFQEVERRVCRNLSPLPEVLRAQTKEHCSATAGKKVRAELVKFLNPIHRLDVSHQVKLLSILLENISF